MGTQPDTDYLQEDMGPSQKFSQSVRGVQVVHSGVSRR